jgi:phosphoglycolate phosphatase
MTEAILFDLDGTLLDTLDDLADSGNYVLALNGWPTHPTEAYRYFVGNGAATLVRRITPEEARTPDELERAGRIFEERYKAHALDKTRPYDGIAETLSEVKRRGVRIAVTSNKPDESTRHTVSHFFGEGFFDFVIGNRPGKPLKPDPAVAITAMKALGASPERCLFVGDTGIDMKTAKNACCVAIGVTWGFRTREELLENGADRLIDSPEEIIALL